MRLLLDLHVSPVLRAGNFKTLQQAIAEYSADAMRIALADAGDAMDDANFEESVANATIMRLTRELAFIDEVLAAAKADQLRSPSSDYFVDRQATAQRVMRRLHWQTLPACHEPWFWQRYAKLERFG